MHKLILLFIFMYLIENILLEQKKSYSSTARARTNWKWKTKKKCVIQIIMKQLYFLLGKRNCLTAQIAYIFVNSQLVSTVKIVDKMKRKGTFHCLLMQKNCNVWVFGQINLVNVTKIRFFIKKHKIIKKDSIGRIRYRDLKLELCSTTWSYFINTNKTLN